MRFIDRIKSKKKIAECKVQLLTQMSKLSRLNKRLERLQMKFDDNQATFDEVDNVTNDILNQLQKWANVNMF